MFCNECGVSNPDTAKFCSGCGRPMQSAAHAENPPPASPLHAPAPASAIPPLKPRAYQTIGANPTMAGTKTPTAQNLLKMGTRFNNRYDILRLIGRGGMGEVYQAHDNMLNFTVALKVLSPALQSSAEAIERFTREAQISLRLSHKYIVRVHDMFIVDSLRCISMEHVAGMDFRQYLDRRAKEGPPLGIKEVRVIGQMVCDAMEYAHEITVHRDLKPENILVTQNAQIKVSDFGIAKVLTGSHAQMTSSVLGTAYYMAPEQSSGSAIDARADIYSLGVILYEALLGRLPIGRFKSPRELRDDVPEVMSAGIMAALETDPGHRPQTMSKFSEALGGARTVVGDTAVSGAQNESKGSLKGGVAQQARDLIEKHVALEKSVGNKMLDMDKLEADETYRNEVVKEAMQFSGLAQQALTAAGYPDAAKAIQDSQVGLLLLIGGYKDLVRTNQGLALTMLQANMLGYFMCIIFAVKAVGLGDTGDEKNYDEKQFVASLLSMTTNMKEQVVDKLGKNQKKTGFLGRLFSS